MLITRIREMQIKTTVKYHLTPSEGPHLKERGNELARTRSRGARVHTYSSLNWESPADGTLVSFKKGNEILLFATKCMELQTSCFMKEARPRKTITTCFSLHVGTKNLKTKDGQKCLCTSVLLYKLCVNLFYTFVKQCLRMLHYHSLNAL